MSPTPMTRAIACESGARKDTKMTELEALAGKLGRKQKLLIMALSEEWGTSIDHQCAKRIWYRDIPLLIDHKHRTDNCWRLTGLGAQLAEHLKTAASLRAIAGTSQEQEG